MAANQNRFSNEDSLFNSMTRLEPQPQPVFKLVHSEDLKANLIKSQLGTSSEMNLESARHSQCHQQTLQIPRLKATMVHQSRTADLPNNSTSNNDLVTVTAQIQQSHLGQQSRLNDVLLMHTTLQKRELVSNKQQSSGLMSQTINLRRTATQFQGTLNMQSPQIKIFQKTGSKNSQTTKNILNSKERSQNEGNQAANFTMKILQAQEDMKLLPKNFDGIVHSDDGWDRINPHIQTSGIKQSTGGKQHLDSNFNDRASEEISGALQQQSPPFKAKNYEKPAAAAVVPFLQQQIHEEQLCEDQILDNIEEFNIGESSNAKPKNIRQMISRNLNSFPQQQSRKNITPLVLKSFRKNLDNEKKMVSLPLVGKHLNFSRNQTVQDHQVTGEEEFFSAPIVEPTIKSNQLQSQKIQVFQISKEESQNNKELLVKIEDADQNQFPSSKVSSPLPHFGINQESELAIESPIKFDALKLINTNSPNQAPTFRKAFSQQSNISLINIGIGGESIDNIYGTNTNRLRNVRKFEEIRILKKRTQIIERAILLFNSGKFIDCIEYLISIEALPRDQEGFFQANHVNDTQVIEFARFLFESEGLDKNMVGEFLGKDKDLSQRTNYAFFSLFPFQNIVIDVAMRNIFKKIRLPKESQQIERIIQAFSQGYWLQNQATLVEANKQWNYDGIEFMALSVLVLNTTYHSDKIPKALKLSKENFIKTNQSVLKDCANPVLMSDIYDRIAKQQFEAKIELQEKFFRRVNDHTDFMTNDQSRQEILKTKGSVFIKYGRIGAPHKRLIRLNTLETKIEWRDEINTREKTRFIQCKDIQQVIVGSDNTKVMQKQKIPIEFDSHCFSIITEKRTLDLRIDDPKVLQLWLDQIRLIIRHNQEINDKKLQENFKELSEQKSQKESILDNIWRIEILINWNNYWEPLKKQLKFNKQAQYYQIKDKEKAFLLFQNLCLKIENEDDSNFERKKILTDLSKEIIERMDLIWQEGLPNFVRICLWPFFVENTISLSIQVYLCFKQQFQRQRLLHQSSSLEAPKLIMYLTGQNNLNDMKLNTDEESLPLADERIERKINKYIDCYESEIEQFNLDKEILKDLVCNAIGSFCLYRPDIGFISGLEKIAAQFAIMYMQRPLFEEEEPFQENLEFQIFQCMANLTQAKERHIIAFLMSDSDEISWRLEYFDKIFERELPQLSLHFKAINLQSQLYLYDWLLSLYTCLFSPTLLWRIWDQYFLYGELYLYKVALGVLRYKQSSLLAVKKNSYLTFIYSNHQMSALKFSSR